ncbi:predicted protein [Verticillium alfalfae VaMs.102]|uniref:Predicted protein n=1 Tax=Verticillium alfalfae (strain VaMs.102 / ATCC MYA-4576 / FGSC 10136) TaxID=526221 RepID=C9S5U9_VERA1|nr:predicted protein [Verticillium alfalfae VaMs.102]EEY15088.1 predicted protein [Verticillium alfalfae VaMs.102]
MSNHISWLGLAALSSIAGLPLADARALIKDNGAADNDSNLLLTRGEHDDTCSSVIINIDPDRYGCGPGQLSVLDTCQDLVFGSDPLSCAGKKCLPGQWCDEDVCRSIQVLTSPLQCGPAKEDCGSNQVCVNGVVQPIDTGFDGTSCGAEGSNKTACNPGWACYENSCTPITIGSNGCGSKDTECAYEHLIIGTDSTHCGSNETACDSGSLCVFSECLPLDLGAGETSDDVAPGSICYDGEIIPIHISTDNTTCGEPVAHCEPGSVCVSGVCISDLYDPSCGHGDKPGSGGAAGGNSKPHHDGNRKPVHGDRPSNTIWRPAPLCPPGKVQAGHLCVDVFGDAKDCSGKPCSSSSLCCRGRCIDFDVGSDASDCDGKCGDGYFCYDKECYPSEIEPVLQCGSQQCAPHQACLGGKVCLDVTGDPQSCENSEPCPANNVCILGSCVSVDTGEDPNACGPKALKCPPGTLCLDSECISAGIPGFPGGPGRPGGSGEAGKPGGSGGRWHPWRKAWSRRV